MKALFTVVVVALILAYGTLCLLFSQGQWQLVLHPSRTVAATPAAVGLAFSEIHFFPGPSGEPQLDGWLIPANSAAPTALMLHGGDGSMADALPDALTLHNAGLNVLLFDYRGFGRSAGRHPDESSMQDDSDAALQFLTATQHTPLPSIVVYGSGLGASLAVRLATNHHEIPAIILDSPDGDFEERARNDPRARLVPTRWLFHQTFPLAAPLQQLTTPKLLITFNAQQPSPALQHAADPKITVELPTRDDAALVTAVQRFVDQYVSRVKGSKAADVPAASVTGGEGVAARGCRLPRGPLVRRLYRFRRTFAKKVLPVDEDSRRERNRTPRSNTSALQPHP